MGFKNLFGKEPKIEEASTKRIGERTVISDCMLGDNISIANDCFLHKVTLNSFSYLAARVTVMNSIIGKFCSIGSGAGICMGMHPSHTFVSSSPVFFSLHKQCGVTFSDDTYFEEMGSCKIGNDIWIGANALIMDNINIGDGAIIGAGSIVTHDVPPYAIVAGVPGRVIRYRFDNDEIEFLLNYKWWDKDPAWIRDNFKGFHDIKTFMNNYKHDNG